MQIDSSAFNRNPDDNKISVSAFEIIDEEQFQVSKSVASGVATSSSDGEDGSVAVMPDLPDATEKLQLEWCEFCKDNYNEYHFGDTDESDR